MKVLLTGATGFLGEHLVAALQAHGHEVRALVRATSRTEALEGAGVEVRVGRLDAPTELAAVAAGVDAVVHAAGGGIVRRREDMRRLNRDGTANLLAACPATVRVFVLVSSVAAHGPSPADEPATEDRAEAPISAYGQSKLAAERVLFARERPFVSIAIRPPALYGPGEHRMVDLFRAAARGVVPMVHPEGTLSLLHGADCAHLIARALERPVAGTYFAAEPQVYRRREMAEAIGRAVGRPVRVVAVPPWALQLAGAVSEGWGRLRDRPVMFSRDKVADMSQPHQTCDPSLAMATFEWEPRQRFDAGAREALADYRRRGWL